MLSKKKQRKYLAKRGNEWKDQLQAFDQTHEQETLHRLRVAIKKIKAFARLSEACSGKKAVKDLKLLKKMFRQAGVIRDADNRMHLLDHFHAAPEAYRQQHRQRQATDTSVFLDQVRQYRKKGKKASRRLLTDLHAIHTPCIRAWYAARLVEISVLLTASGDRLHKARREIKELLYVLKLLPSRLSEGLRLDEDYLDQLQDAIGKWHDAAMVVASWAAKDLADSQAMVRECREKEAVVRRLAADFDLRAHTM